MVKFSVLPNNYDNPYKQEIIKSIKKTSYARAVKPDTFKKF